MRRELVLHPVPRDERDIRALDRPDPYWSRGLAPRRVEVELLDVVEQRIEPRASEDAHSNRTVGRRRGQADFSFDPELFDPEDPEPPVEPEDDVAGAPSFFVELSFDESFDAGSFVVSLPPSEDEAVEEVFLPRESVT